MYGTQFTEVADQKHVVAFFYLDFVLSVLFVIRRSSDLAGKEWSSRVMIRGASPFPVNLERLANILAKIFPCFLLLGCFDRVSSFCTIDFPVAKRTLPF
jgi:hypothetical protein